MPIRIVEFFFLKMLMKMSIAIEISRKVIKIKYVNKYSTFFFNKTIVFMS